ncbi:MAG: universal stress protein, partial [Bacteroidetes bacterium]|nr:universal stress protein [Bacteroidota bacterium]
MNKVLVLVDFTPTAEKAAQQGVYLAKKFNSSITFCHVYDSAPSDEKLANDMSTYVAIAQNGGIEHELNAPVGDFFAETELLTERINPAITVVGTHGKKGLKQNLFGAHIYKLANHVKGNLLIVSDSSTLAKNGFSKVLMPVSAHTNYSQKVKATTTILAESGHVDIFALHKPGMPLSEKVQHNIENALALLKDANVNCGLLEQDAQKFSIGFSKETFDVMEKEQNDLITIMTKVSKEGGVFGKIDKENLILNPAG